MWLPLMWRNKIPDMKLNKKSKLILAAIILFLIITFFFYKYVTQFVFTVVLQTPLKDFGILTNQQQQAAQMASSSDCDPSLWDRVYHPERLQIVKNCIEITGTIKAVAQFGDGDAHILLLPDQKYAKLVNFFNKLYDRDSLILEIVCQGEIEEKEIADTCHGYQNQISRPIPGKHIRVWGDYVIDKTYGWAEIHPVSKIDILK